MPRPAFLLLLFLALLLPARAEDKPWKVFAVPGRFQVEMPDGVEQHEQAGDYPGMMYESYASEPLQAFAVLVSELPSGAVQDSGEDPMLVAAVNGRLKAVGGDLLRARRIVSQRLPGCMFEIETEDTRFDFMVRLLGDRMYTLSVTSEKDGQNPEAVKRFFDSFHVP